MANEQKNFSLYFKRENLLRKRIAAFSIDLFAIIFITKSFLVSYSIFLKKFSLPIYMEIQPQWYWAYNRMELAALLSVYTGYFFLSLYLSQGKTLGKTVVGLKIISRENPGEIYWWQAATRSFTYFMCYMMGMVLFALPALNRAQKGLPDWISSTHVISQEAWEEGVAFLNQQDNRKAVSLELLISGQDDDLAA